MTLYVSKVVAFRQFGAMPADVFLQGVLVGTSLMIGTYAGKAVVLRLSADLFRHVLDAVMLCSGLALIGSALRSAS